MTQPARTTETANRDHATIRDLMNQIQDRLTVPDRATLALGLIGHLATLMNGRQIAKLMDELVEQAERVQDVPPRRRAAREDMPDDTAEARAGSGAARRAGVRDQAPGVRDPAAADDSGPDVRSGARASGRTAERADARRDRNASHDDVGVQGRGPLTGESGPIL